jgi:hypothetical protein
VEGFTTGSRGTVPGKACERRIINNNNIIMMIMIFSLAQ